MRYRCTLTYDGTGLVGWQRQANGASVQAHVEDAFEALCHVPCCVVAAGRTDAGVHALGQVVHVDLAQDIAPKTIRDAVNFHLHRRGVAIALLDVTPVPPSFHARFSACMREYHYDLYAQIPPLVLQRGRAWHVRRRSLDVNAMQEASRFLVGHQDFSSFRARHCQAPSPCITMYRCEVLPQPWAPYAVRVVVRARSFLHHMVRNIVGSLVDVGIGRSTAKELRSILQQRNRQEAGPTAPAWGLYFNRVWYGNDTQG